MRRIIVAVLLSINLLVACSRLTATESALTQVSESPPQTRELAEFSDQDLQKAHSTTITLFGLRLGMSEQEIDAAIAPFRVTKISLGPMSYNFFAGPTTDDPGTGVTVFMKENRIVEMDLGPTTSFADPGTPQRTYIERLSPTIKPLFEKYTDPLRVQLFGEVASKVLLDNGAHRQYLYEYPSRGFRLLVFSTKRAPDWETELASLALFPPTPSQ